MDISVSQTVSERYAAGAARPEQELCCAVDYDPAYLKAIPREVIERDYGCGDPSRYLNAGETVLDLGSGSGKICFIAAQIVGPAGQVIGVDMTPEMLALARRSAPKVAENIGYANVEFRRGHIQDLRTDLDLMDTYLRDHPVAGTEDYARFQELLARQRQERPLIADDSIDVIVSNCVLNLVSDAEKDQLFTEMYRVLRPGGRIAVSDIVSDKPSPAHLKEDPDLWSGCVSGALQEAEFLTRLQQVGFYGCRIDKLDAKPWRIVEGIEYRAATIVAWKEPEGLSIDKNQAVIYRGPWTRVEDDDGHSLVRGQRMAVSEKTFEVLTRAPYTDDIIPVPPHVRVEEDRPFDCGRDAARASQETKRGVAPVTTEAGETCSLDACGPKTETPCCS